ncbi:aminotransferase class I/II-fold pyridoxal phosphate-dependent enzyme [Tersicoccus sp. Bi-70]|uniref:aminotransferase class I/II-fold pyridoxal phosphate-dependent enzyme n=1 Tax=Tersicoccus sp. Bi-70 TaxID=1897634 RepID=UPI0009756FFE|nr:aminotransferase class I/II-fold pyridoxal phosphate-dependent enzyme [Tersicoccus sp. Bi-70]OMH36744.1 aminotransferase [Tersicoccus sp. Bi-70]
MTTTNTGTPAAPWQRAAHGANLLDAGGTLAGTIFEEMTVLAGVHDAVNLGQGFPDEDGPAEILEAARSAIAGGANQYAPGRGVPVLREAIAAHQARFYGLTVDPAEEVLVTTGATEAIAATLLALTGPGDEVLTFEPFYDSYGAMIELTGARHVTVPLREPDFLPDEDELAAAVTDRTRVILLNNPHNPTGTVFGAALLARIVEEAARHDAIIVTDEVYEHLIFDRVTHVPVATLPGAAERTLTISSAGKTFSVTGWKVGWLTGPADLVAAVRTVKQFLTYSSGSPLQGAVALGLGLGDDVYAGLAASLQRKRDLLVDGLRGAGFEVTVPAGTYFVVADATPLLGGDVTDGAQLCRRLPATAGVAAIPLTAFCHPGSSAAATASRLIRFAFCKREDVLAEAVRRLTAFGSAGA